FDPAIERALAAASCVMVVWTRHSVRSRWVLTEAAEGHKRGRSVRKFIPGSGGAVVVPQQPAQPLAAPHLSADDQAGPRHDQSVAEPLMVPLPVVVHDELIERADQAPFPEENQAV